MEFSSVLTWITGFISWTGLSGSAAISGLLFIALLVFACYRARSSHFLFARLWLLLHGKRQFHDKELNDFFERRDSLMRFRFLTGMPLRTLPIVNSVRVWADQQDIEVGEIAACGNYFDPETLAINMKTLPSEGVVVLRMFLFVLLGFITAIALTLAGAGKVLLQFNEGGHRWFYFHTDAVIEPFSNKVRFNIDDCNSNKEKIIKLSGWSKEDVQLACDALQEPNQEKTVNTLLSEQRRGMGAIGVLLLIFSWVSWLMFWQGKSARELNSRLEKKNKASEEVKKSESGSS